MGFFDKIFSGLSKTRGNLEELEELFQDYAPDNSEFYDEPIGSASIGQAHKAVLLDGTVVVTKVRRPLIAEMMRSDYSKNE